jgi:glycosyltransferase involved in cell wall biosynthesis
MNCKLSKCAVSVIIPAYNEKSKIKHAIETARCTIRDANLEGEIIIAEDGSNDGTREIVAQMANLDSRIILISSDQRLGRGRALNRAIKASNGNIVCYIDADLATDMAHLPELIDAVMNKGFDFATGSRCIQKSEARRNKKRFLASRVYNGMVRLILGSEVYDHQCGFKAFDRNRVISLLDEVKDNNWFWDTEILVRGQKHGYRIKEIPVKWKESDSTKVNILKDANEMGRQIFGLWWDLKGNSRRKATKFSHGKPQ